MDSKKHIESELTEKQKIFCREYVFDWNATRAAKAAGYSETTAYSIGSENLRKPEIQAYIKYLKENLAETAGISQLMVISELKKIAFSSIAHLHNTWIERKEFEQLTEDQKACIQEIDTKIIKKVNNEFSAEKGEFEKVSYDVEYVKIKLYDKIKSIDTINKMLGYESASKIDLSNTDGTLSNLSQLSTDELIRRAEAAKAIEQVKKSE